MEQTFSCNNEHKLKHLLNSTADKLRGNLFMLMSSGVYATRAGSKEGRLFLQAKWNIIYLLNLSGDDAIPRKRVDKDSSIGAIVGGAVGGVLVILLVITVVLIMRCKQNKKKKGSPKPLPSVLYSAVVCGVVNQSINQSIMTTQYFYVKRGKIPSQHQL